MIATLAYATFATKQSRTGSSDPTPPSDSGHLREHDEAPAAALSDRRVVVAKRKAFYAELLAFLALHP